MNWYKKAQLKNIWQMTISEFFEYKRNDMSKIKDIVGENIPTTEKELPSIKDDCYRIYHGTYIKNLKNIIEQGILTGSQINKGEKLSFILASLEYSNFGDINIVADVNKESVILYDKTQRSINKWVQINRNITTDEIVGVIGYSQPINHMEVIREHKNAVIEAYNQRLNVPLENISFYKLEN